MNTRTQNSKYSTYVLVPRNYIPVSNKTILSKHALFIGSSRWGGGHVGLGLPGGKKEDEKGKF